MEHASRGMGEVENSTGRDAAFEQLLRLAASYVSRKRLHAKARRGASDGHDLDDWLQAERQLLEGLKTDKSTLRVALAFGLLSSEKYLLGPGSLFPF